MAKARRNNRRNNENRLPKADYFRKRYSDAIADGLTEKAEYYKNRLIQMGEPYVEQSKHFGLTRHEFGNGLVIYSL